MEVRYLKSFQRDFKKLNQKIRRQFIKRKNLFIRDKNNRLLNIHRLKGKYNNMFSWNVNADFRVIYFYSKEDKVYYFVRIGMHSQLYK